MALSRRVPVDVVIPTRDRDPFLRESIASVLSQARPVNRIIVVADGDRTPELPEPERSAVQLVANRGPAGAPGARNTGLALASSDWIVFLDDDDVWDPNYTEVMAAEMERASSSIAALFPRFRVRRVDGSVRELPRTSLPPTELELLIGNLVGTTSFVLCRRAAVVSAGGFDVALAGAQDWDLWLRMAASGVFQPVARSLGTYRVHERGQISIASPSERFGRYLAFYHKRMSHRLFAQARRTLAQEIYWWAVLMAWTGDVAGAIAALELAERHAAKTWKARVIGFTARSRFRRQLLWLLYGWRAGRMRLEDRLEHLPLA